MNFFKRHSEILFGLSVVVVVYLFASDFDDDGVRFILDKCPRVANSDQLDSDFDGLGDACDSCPNEHSTDSDLSGVNGLVSTTQTETCSEN